MPDINRRHFLLTSAIIPVTSLLTRNAFASEQPKLSPDDKTATALGYIEQSETPEKTCANCQLYTGEAGSEWGGCAIFPGKLVASNGWCKSWVVKAG